MDKFGFDYELNRDEEQALSIDSILAEFQTEKVLRSDYAPLEDEPGYFEPQPSDYDDDVRIYAPEDGAPAPEAERGQSRGEIGAMEAEARRYIAELRERAQTEYDEAQYDSPEAADPLRELEAGDEAEAEPEIDSRFNLSGQSDRRGIVFGDKAVDIDADSEYKPKRQTGEVISHWAPEPDPEAEDEDDPARYRKKNKKKKKKDKDKAKPSKTPDASEDGDFGELGFDDGDAEHADYAAQRHFEPSKKYDADDPGYFPSSLREYVVTLLASFFLRLRGSAGIVENATMNDSEEDLGPELSPAAASKYYGSYIKSQRLRLRISAALLVILCYITLGLPVPGMLRHLPVAAIACCALQLGVILLSLDVFTTGFLSIFRLKLGADGLAVLSCLFTTADALIVALSDSAAIHMPLCALSSLSMLGVLLASSLNTRALRKATRVPAIGRHFYAVTGEIKFKSRQLTLLKSMKNAAGFVRRAEEAPPDESFFIRLGPVLLLLALLLTTAVAAVHKCYSDFPYILSVVFAPAAPLMALSAYALPYFLGSTRLFKSGAAIAGWSGLCDIGGSRNLIVTDRDLFPEGSVTLDGIRIFADEDAQKVIACAGTLICASGSCASGCFARLMEENGCAMKQVEAFEYLPGGGMRGLIDGQSVLCGSTDLMRLMNVRIPFRLTDKTSVLLAIDGVLYGIFAVKYTPQPQVRRALVELVRSTRHPVFAIRDFNVTPEMLHNTYDLATDGYDFPPYVERFDLSEPSKGKSGKIAAVICSEGLAPLTEVADVGRSMYVASRVNLLVSALSAFLGVFMVFLKLLLAGSVSASYMLLFMAVWTVPVLVMSVFVMLRR